MNQVMTQRVLEQENRAFSGRGGVSAESRSSGFVPAFQNMETGSVQRSRFANGSPAPFHLLDGLPDEFVVARDASGKVMGIKASVRSGFLREGKFYSRDEASAVVCGSGETSRRSMSSESPESGCLDLSAATIV